MSSTPINYIEFKALDLEAVKAFYHNCFGWNFTDYGPTYTAFSSKESGIDGGFERSEKETGHGALVVLYHKNLEHIQTVVQENGGRISVEIFSFPGGRRFHFIDPEGNELAIWSDN